MFIVVVFIIKAWWKLEHLLKHMKYNFEVHFLLLYSSTPLLFTGKYCYCYICYLFDSFSYHLICRF